MYIYSSDQSLIKSLFMLTLITVLSLVFFTITPFNSAQAQSYEQRQKILRFQKHQRIQAQKRARYRRYQQQRRPQKNTGLFGALFAPQKFRRRAVPNFVSRAKPSYQPRKTRKKGTLKKPVQVRNFNNTKVKKIKSTKGSLSRSSKKGTGRKGGRAMCVRLCDGFYWPLSRIGLDNKKTKSKAICQNSCSATTRIYYAGGTGDAGQSMRDRRGNRYKDLKNAFSYRKKLSRTCRCRPEPWTEAAQKMYNKRTHNSEKLRLTDLSEHKEKAKRAVKFRTSMAD